MLNIPCNLVKQRDDQAILIAGQGQGLVGLQLIGNYFGEAKLLNIAHQFQLATDWHKRRPEQH